MSKSQVIADFNCTSYLTNADDPIQVKSRFKRKPFQRQFEESVLSERCKNPCEVMYADEVTGFSEPTIDGAKSAYVFWCKNTCMEFTFLSAGKKYFYLVLDRMAKLADRYHWTIRQLYVDPAGEEWGGRTEIVAEIWGITIIAQPPHVWQEQQGPTSTSSQQGVRLPRRAVRGGWRAD